MHHSCFNGVKTDPQKIFSLDGIGGPAAPNSWHGDETNVLFNWQLCFFRERGFLRYQRWMTRGCFWVYFIHILQLLSLHILTPLLSIVALGTRIQFWVWPVIVCAIQKKIGL